MRTMCAFIACNELYRSPYLGFLYESPFVTR